MKLTRLQKEAIVRAIMQDVPTPNEVTAKIDIQTAVVKAMSPAVRKVYREQPKALTKAYVAGYAHGFGYSFEVVSGDVDMAPILKPYAEAAEEHKRARKQLEGAVMACNTLAALEKMLPEFKKYFPTEAQPTKNLPALANVVADLTKLGWPKQKGEVNAA